MSGVRGGGSPGQAAAAGPSGLTPPAAPGPWALDDRPAPLLVGMAWALIVLMVVPDKLDYASLDTITPAAGSKISRALWLALLVGSFAILAMRMRMTLLLLRHCNPFLLAFVVLALASVAWSIDPGVTARRLIRVFAFLGVTLALMTAGWQPQRFERTVRPIITLLLGGSLLFGMFAPQLAIHSSLGGPELVGAWHGLANHKNGLGALAGFGMILWMHAWLTRGAGRGRALVGFSIAAACLVLSRSSTSMVTTAFALAFLALVHSHSPLMRRWLPWLIAAFAATLVLYTLVTLRLLPGSGILLSPIAALTGKDMSFTGRAEIWKILIEQMRDHRMLGTGLGAFWTSPDPMSPSWVFIERMRFWPASAHNGYLEVLNELGIVGLCCLVGYLVSYLRQALRVAHFDMPRASLYLALVLQQAVTNLSESRWFSALSVDFLIMMFATISLARLQLQQSLQPLFVAPQAAGPPSPPGARHAHA